MSRRALRAFALAFTASLSLAPAVVHAQGAPPPTELAVKTATLAFQKGTKLFQGKKFALALAEFQKSYDTVNSPNSLLYIARCQVETGAHKEAYVTFGRVVREAEERGKTETKYLPTRDSAKAERDDVGNKIALVTVNVQNAKDATRLKVGGAPVAREDWGSPIPLDPGVISIELESDGLETVTQSVDVKKGDKKVLDLAVKEPEIKQELPPPPPPPSEGPSGLFIGGLVAASVGVIGMGVFGVAGGMTLSTFSEVEDTCGRQPNGTCSGSSDLETIDRGQTEQTIANIGLIVGAVGLAAGATLLVVDLATSDSGSDSDAPTATPPATAKLSVGPGYVGVSGTF